MAESGCLQDHELLPLIDDPLVAGRSTEHLDHCPTCQQRLTQLRGEIRALRENAGSDGAHREASS